MSTKIHRRTRRIVETNKYTNENLFQSIVKRCIIVICSSLTNSNVKVSIINIFLESRINQLSRVFSFLFFFFFFNDYYFYIQCLIAVFIEWWYYLRRDWHFYQEPRWQYLSADFRMKVLLLILQETISVSEVSTVFAVLWIKILPPARFDTIKMSIESGVACIKVFLLLFLDRINVSKVSTVSAVHRTEVLPPVLMNRIKMSIVLDVSRIKVLFLVPLDRINVFKLSTVSTV